MPREERLKPPRSDRRGGIYLLYDVGLHLAGIVALPWIGLRALCSPSFRRGLAGRLGGGPLLAGEGSCLLLHGVSVGEIRAARPLVEAILRTHPRTRVVLSSTTNGGREVAARTFPVQDVVTFPIDLAWACRRFLKRIQPTGVILMELEIWPNFLRECERAGVPVAIVNGRITERSANGYLKVHRFLPQFDRIRLYGAQNERYAGRFRSLPVAPQRIEVTGNLKYDVLPSRKQDQEYRRSPWPAWIGGRDALAFGSTHHPEELELLKAARGIPELEAALWLIAPRHPRRAGRLEGEIRSACPGRPVLRRSRLAAQEPLPSGAILLVDTLGELELVYRSAKAAFVGGSLVPHGGQNVLEPAALGCPVVVGPHTENFREEVDTLLRAGGIRRAETPAALLELMADWLRDPAAAETCSRAALQALSGQQGAVHATLDSLTRAGLLT
ncbi:MAG: 3-deoxy-D-manno-octulosonic acid transferase [Planctomycetota bacterium]